jgi:diadenosine tetraphosphate (Ap4A) HIT family hydrolase
LGGKGALGNGDRAGMDEEGEIDMSMFQRKEQSQADLLQREAQRAMKAQQQLRKTVESCRRCTESRTFLRSTVISKGENAVLRMKTDPDVLVEGHLEIIPISHVSSILQCDEETQKEISNIQNSLRRLYEKQGKGVLFIETAVHFHSRPHAHIDVIPIEAGMEDEASMFFKEVRVISVDWRTLLPHCSAVPAVAIFSLTSDVVHVSACVCHPFPGFQWSDFSLCVGILFL